jgi:hypothetical protein
MLGDAIAVGLAVAIYEFVGTAICGVVYLVKGRLAKQAAVEECSVQDDDAKELYEPVEASDEYEGSLTRVVLALKASSSSQIFLRRSDVAMLVEKLTSSDNHQFASPKLHKRLTLIDGSLSSLGPQAAEATMYTATLSSSSQQHDDASSMCSSVRSSDRGSYRKEYSSSSSSSNYSDEQQYTPQQAAHRRASSSADTVLTESSATPQRVSMSQRPRRASSVATDMDGTAELQEQQQAPATPSVAQVATAVASARALARMRAAAAAASSASGGSPGSAAAATTRKRVSYSAPRKSAPDDAQGDSYDDYWL